MSPRLPYPEMIPGLPAPEIKLEPKEGDLQTQVLAYLKLIPGLVYRRTNSGLAKPLRGPGFIHLAPAGTPDITGHMPDGRALYIELKDPKRKASRDDAKRREAIEAQERFIAAAAAAGCVAFRATSLQEVADRIGKELKG